MSNERVDILLEKYWNCETSVPEEKELRDFFLGDNVPERFRQYIPLFSYISDEQSVALSEGFNERLQHALAAGGKGGRYITIRVFAPLLRVAVSLLLVVGLGISFYFITKQDNRPRFVETFEDPNAAIQQVTFALDKLSYALQKSETASVETIHFIDDLDIDWAVIDALNKVNPVEADSLTNEK